MHSPSRRSPSNVILFTFLNFHCAKCSTKHTLERTMSTNHMEFFLWGNTSTLALFLVIIFMFRVRVSLSRSRSSKRHPKRCCPPHQILMRSPFFSSSSSSYWYERNAFSHLLLYVDRTAAKVRNIMTQDSVTTTTAKTTSFSWTPNFSLHFISFHMRYPLETAFTVHQFRAVSLSSPSNSTVTYCLAQYFSFSLCLAVFFLPFSYLLLFRQDVFVVAVSEVSFTLFGFWSYVSNIAVHMLCRCGCALLKRLHCGIHVDLPCAPSLSVTYL